MDAQVTEFGQVPDEFSPSLIRFSKLDECQHPSRLVGKCRPACNLDLASQDECDVQADGHDCDPDEKHERCQHPRLRCGAGRYQPVKQF